MIEHILRISVIIGLIYPVALHNPIAGSGSSVLNTTFNFPCESALHESGVGDEVIGFLDISSTGLSNVLKLKTENVVDVMFSSLTMVVLSHEDISEDHRLVDALNETIAMLICKAREHNVRLIYRLQLSNSAARASHHVDIALRVLSLDGISIHMMTDALKDKNTQDNILSLINQVRKVRFDATIILEYPALFSANCSWAWSLLTSLDYLYVPTYVDDDCPAAGFMSKENVSDRLLAMSKAAAMPDHGMSQIILGIAAFGLDFDCASVTNGHCHISSVCANRITPRSKLSSYSIPTVITTGKYHRFIDFEVDLLAKIDLKASHNLGGFGLYRLNDLNWSDSSFWKNVSMYKMIGDDLYHHDGLMVIVFVLLLCLILS